MKFKEVIRACERAGFVYDPKHKHPRLTDPASGRFVSFSHTPSCPHWYKHLVKDIRKYLNIEVTLR